MLKVYFDRVASINMLQSVIAEILSFDGGSINEDTDDELDHHGMISNRNFL